MIQLRQFKIHLAILVLALAAPATASTFLDILPPGQDGLVPLSGTRGPHLADQVPMYSDLILRGPGTHVGRSPPSLQGRRHRRPRDPGTRGAAAHRRHDLA